MSDFDPTALFLLQALERVKAGKSLSPKALQTVAIKAFQAEEDPGLLCSSCGKNHSIKGLSVCLICYRRQVLK